MAGEWIRLFVRWGYALEQEHVRLYDFLSFYETADASMQAFLDEVCVCMRNHQNPSGQKIWQDCLQKHKRELQITIGKIKFPFIDFGGVGFDYDYKKYIEQKIIEGTSKNYVF